MAFLVTAFRLGVLTGHLVPSARDDLVDSNDRFVSLATQDCAAHCTLHARPTAPGCTFARPVKQAPSCAEVEAVAAAAAVLRVNSPSAPTTPRNHPTNDYLPLFARPETIKAAPKALPPLPPRTAAPVRPVAASGHWAPQASVLESDFGYVLQVAMPGVEAADVRAELLAGGRLAVAGVRHARVAGGATGGLPDLMAALPEVFGVPAEGRGGVRVVAGAGDVLATGRFRLVWQIPEDANQDSLRADFKDGCLLVHVTKKNVISLF